MSLLFVLGFSSGLPLLLVFGTLTAWLSEVGIDKSTIGAFALASAPYSFKFLWAPLIDQARLPVLRRLLGQRRSWMLVSQLALIAAICALAFSDPSESVARTGTLAVVVAFLSATQDVVLDAYRVEILAPSEQAAGSAVFVFGYRVAMLAAGAGALFLAAWFEHGGQVSALSWLATAAGSAASPWALTYAVMAALMGVGVVGTLLASEPRHAEREAVVGPWLDRVTTVVTRAVIEPFRDFAKRDGWIAILLFVVLFKLADALAAAMQNPFLLEIGFAKEQIAAIAKTFGLAASIAGALLGGLLVKSLGLRRSIWITCVAMMVSNLVFAAQAVVGADASFLVLTISVENLIGGFGTATFVAYLSLLCNVRFTATQYALLTSLSSVGRTLFAAASGVAAEAYGWVGFFVWTTAAGIPALLLFAQMDRRRRTGVESTAE